MHLKFHFHFSEIIQMSSVNTEPSQQWELFSILLWRGSWFWLFTHFGAIKSPRLRLGLFIAPKCVKSQNQLPFHTIKSVRFLEFCHFLKVKDWWNKFKSLFHHFLFTVCEHTCTLYKNRSSDTWYDTKITFSKRCEGTCFYPLHFAYKSCLPFRSFL